MYLSLWQNKPRLRDVTFEPLNKPPMSLFSTHSPNMRILGNGHKQRGQKNVIPHTDCHFSSVRKAEVGVSGQVKQMPSPSWFWNSAAASPPYIRLMFDQGLFLSCFLACWPSAAHTSLLTRITQPKEAGARLCCWAELNCSVTEPRP